MNRIILIGNGFDLAHGLKTKYEHFIDWYWSEWQIRLINSEKQIEEDALCSFSVASDDKCFKDFIERFKPQLEYKSQSVFFNNLARISTCVKRTVFF
mgnify:CR=1 FL=1